MNQGLPNFLRLRVITSGKVLVDADVEEVSLPSLEGYLGILPGHRPLYTGLGTGTLTYRAARGEESFSIHGGYAEVSAEEVLVYTELSPDERKKPSRG